MKPVSKDSTFLCVVFVLFLATHLCGVYLFATGFFPLKENFKGFSGKDDFNHTEGPEGLQVPAKYDRLVLMVIDAFRSDLFFGQNSEMKFVKSLLENGGARGYVSKAHAPTVTLPRIKALISGSIPNFADFIMNFDSHEFKDDNVVSQFKLAGKKVVFYGDDTWVKLFPTQFDRSEGVSSFFVSDYTEVDNNVTRHLAAELEVPQDWSALILHYLGLDHIGHLEGPYSSKMDPKIKEMDSLIEYIYNMLTHQYREDGTRSLLVVCSDHGMNEVGNHGGTSEGETSAVMVFMSPSLEARAELAEVTTVSQVDLTPTLSLLFGLPIPKNSMGTLIPELFTNYTVEEYLRALEMNSLQRLQLMKANSKFWANDRPTKFSLKLMELFEEAQQMHASWAATPLKHSHFEAQAAHLYIEFMRTLYKEFAHALTTYDDYTLILGLIMISTSTIGFLVFVWAFLRHFVLQVPQIFGSSLFWLLFAVLTSATMLGHFQIYCPLTGSALCVSHNMWIMYVACILVSGSISLVVGTAVFGFSQRVTISKPERNGSVLFYFLIFGSILHLVSLFGSSLVEEEHQTWYFLLTTALVLAFISSFFEQKNNAWGILITLVCLRFVRVWNQTGVKWMDTMANTKDSEIDIGRWLDDPHFVNRLTRFCLGGIACVVPCVYAGRVADSEKMLIGKVTSAVFRNSINFCGLSIFVYKLTVFPTEYFPPIWMAWFVYLCFFVAMFVVIGYPFWKGQKRVPDKTIQSQPTRDDLIMTYAKVTPMLLLFAYTMLLLLLAKVHNMFVLVLLGIIAHYLPTYTKKSTHYYTRILEIVLITHYMGQSAFFALGNSNSLATIDLSGAYTGISSYSIVPVGILIFINGYAGPIFFALSAIVFVAREYYDEHTVKATHTYGKMFATYIFVCFCFALIRSLQLLVFSIVTMIMKHHLFVWSVFSPKYIYEGLADGYLLFNCAVTFILFVHTGLIGLLLNRRRKKQNKVV